ncbi:hypothetical protein AWB74_08631 [Caballeronia arvi]|uniref:Uncharacterized protein n=2 Tax=Caballeronia arvi TaxID=1777135 RepID=A0A158L6D7_9BURK|nr:hypothetical protein AWB74_08631 [Caballeronia arvi]
MLMESGGGRRLRGAVDVDGTRIDLLAMHITIIAHQAASSGDPEFHCFTFRVEEAGTSREDTITIRTARVLAQELANRSGLDAMVRAILAAHPNDYDALVGSDYQDT